MVTLAEYLEAMPADQKSIYYAAGDSTDRLAKLPIVNTVLGKGYDVLLCTKDVDEFCFQAMMTYGPEAEQDAEGKDIEGTGPKELKNVASGDLDFASEEEKKEAEEAEKDNEALLAAMKEQLGDAVTKVAVSTRLTDAPSAVTTEGPVSLEMERLMSQMPDGMGEVIKYGCIADRALFDLAKDPPGTRARLPEIIARSLAIKRDVVQKDECDRGERMLLNFGHTLGHALEAALKYQGLTHGEAVGAGMYLISRAAEQKGLTKPGTADEIAGCLSAWNLPVTAPRALWPRMAEALGRDKKHLDGK